MQMFCEGLHSVSIWFIYPLTRGTRQEINRQRVLQIIFTQKLTGAPMSLQRVNIFLIFLLVDPSYAEMQAGSGNPLVCASLGLRNVCETVRQKDHAIVYQCQKWFGITEHTANNLYLFAQCSSRMHKFVKCLHVSHHVVFPRKNTWWETNFVRILYKPPKLDMNLVQTFREPKMTGLVIPNP